MSKALDRRCCDELRVEDLRSEKAVVADRKDILGGMIVDRKARITILVKFGRIK